MTRRVGLLGRISVAGALIVAITLLAASAASAATKVPVWSSGGTNLSYGKEVAVNAPSVTGMDLRWTWQGAPFSIECESLSTTGTVENFASGKPGTMKVGAGSKFTGCLLIEAGTVQTIWNGTTCSVPKEIPVSATGGELTNLPYTNGGLKLTNLSLSFEISKCPGAFLQNMKWQFTGNPTGNEGWGAWPGEILYPEGTPMTVNFGASGANIEFGLNVQGPGFTPVKITEEEIVEPSTPGHRYWYTGGGQRKGEGPLTLVPAGTPLSITGASNTVTIAGYFAGIKTTISCSGGGSTTGTVENPAGGSDGIATATFGFGGCKLIGKPGEDGCTVKGGGFSTNSLQGALSTTGAPPLLKVKPASGQLGSITLTGCSTMTWLNTTFPFTGAFYVSPYAGAGKWSIPAWANPANPDPGFRLGGTVASISGELAAETTSGIAVSLH